VGGYALVVTVLAVTMFAPLKSCNPVVKRRLPRGYIAMALADLLCQLYRWPLGSISTAKLATIGVLVIHQPVTWMFAGVAQQYL